MSQPVPTTALQLRSLLKASGELELSLADVPVPTPKENEVLVRIEASPINPSDLALLIGMADLSTLKTSGTAKQPVTTARMPEKLMRALASRVGESMPVGNEGAGVVVAAGSSEAAQSLLGKTVAVLGGAMYAQYRCLHLSQVMPLPDGASFADGASCFVNPL
ncbi:MAG: NADH oxidase, partial [Rhizobacter sp.]